MANASNISVAFGEYKCYKAVDVHIFRFQYAFCGFATKNQLVWLVQFANMYLVFFRFLTTTCVTAFCPFSFFFLSIL